MFCCLFDDMCSVWFMYLVTTILGLIQSLVFFQGATASTVAWSGPGGPSIATATGQNAELVSSNAIF